MGPSQVYWNDVRLGSPKSQATLRYTKETVQAALEEAGLNVISRKVKETMEVDVVIADLKLDQMRYVYDQAASFASRSTIRANAYIATTTVTMRFKETPFLSGTVAVTLRRAGFVGTPVVMKSDYSETYTKGTDWTGTASVGTVALVSGGGITDPSSVHVFYNQSATVERLDAGGELADFEAVLRVVHELDDGKALEFYAYRTHKIGASEIAIQMAAEFPGEPMTFHCVGDLAQPVGRQLFRFLKET